MTIVVNIIGILGSVCIALSLFPQTIKTIQKQSMVEISLPFVFVTMIGASCQLLYGIYYIIFKTSLEVSLLSLVLKFTV